MAQTVKKSSANAGDLGSIPESGRSPGGGHGNPLQDSCLEIPWTEEPGGLQPMRSQKSLTQLSDQTTTLSCDNTKIKCLSGT